MSNFAVLKVPLDFDAEPLRRGLVESMKGCGIDWLILIPLETEFLVGSLAKSELERLHKDIHKALEVKE